LIASKKKHQAKAFYRVLLKGGYKPEDMVEILTLVADFILNGGEDKKK